MGIINDIADKFLLNKKKIQRSKFDNLSVPLLILDGTWHEMMGKGRKTDKISSLEKKLTQLLKEQGKLNTDIKNYANIKKDMMSKIINLTPDVFDENNPDAKEQMSKSHKNILDINNKFIAIENRLADIECDINQTNHELFYESIKLIYSELNDSKIRLQVAGSQIEQLRAMLKVRLDEKAEHEERVQSIYTYMHKMLGPEFSNIVDAEFENE